jgi:translation initiation factor IF-1
MNFQKRKNQKVIKEKKQKIGFVTLTGIVTDDLPGDFFNVKILFKNNMDVLPKISTGSMPRAVVSEDVHSNTSADSNKEFVIITCYISGRMRMNHIHILSGDTVRVEVSILMDLMDERIKTPKGRIVFREKITQDDHASKIAKFASNAPNSSRSAAQASVSSSNQTNKESLTKLDH